MRGSRGGRQVLHPLINPPNKNRKNNNVVKVGPFWQNFLDPRMNLVYSEPLGPDDSFKLKSVSHYSKQIITFSITFQNMCSEYKCSGCLKETFHLDV